MAMVRLTALSGLGPFSRVCDEAGDSVLRDVLRRVGVPRPLIDRPKGLIPVPVLFALLGEGARRTGNELFGLGLGRAMAPGDFGAWSHYALSAPTLGDALARAQRTVPYHQPGSTFTVTRRADVVVWRCHPAQDRGLGLDIHADHLLTPMLRAARLYLGENWKPPTFHVPYPRPAHAAVLERELGSRIVFDDGGTGLSIPAALLATHRPFRPDFRPVTMSDLRRMVASRPARTMSSSVQGLIAFGPESPGTDVDTIAGLLCLTVRGLQRHLQQEGTTFRELVARSRAAEAMSLVQETDLSFSDISWRLGYSELPHFSRAFARVVGLSPSRFRQSFRNPAGISSAINRASC